MDIIGYEFVVSLHIVTVVGHVGFVVTIYCQCVIIEKEYYKEEKKPLTYFAAAFLLSRGCLPFFVDAGVLVLVLPFPPFFDGACVVVVVSFFLCASKNSHPSARYFFLVVVARG